MAADEPPYLTIGTDVSAKYKGAFCEAKIKKVNRVVKCKVTFKNNLGSFLVTDDQIKGSLRLGADIEARHPEKSQFCEAVINKLQDYSQYTVVFDDGDETTLRRTSLCLKSGRHFAESPTLDQFPLTNPEHFGTPVIGSGKFKRKRRSTVNSSLDYESSDDDCLPRKLKAIRGKERDPDLGKVVCVDYGDRRKKDSWYPGLIVPLPPQSNIRILKEEHLVRSFKDGKYYQVPKRDIREFTKEAGIKVENNALKIAVEKASAYLEKEELPPHWDKVLFMALSGDEESNDSESDSSDDEPSEEKDRFVAQLYKFMDERGTPINKAPTVSNRDLNLYKLFKIMHKLGGYNKVTNKNKWKTVYSKMGLPHSITNGPNQMKVAYKRYLQSFEDFYRKLGCTMVNNSRSTRGRHRSDRNIIITRTRDREAASPKNKSGKEGKVQNEKKTEDKPKAVEKKEIKSDETPKTDEKVKIPEKKKAERVRPEDPEKQKKEDRRRLVRTPSIKAETKEEEVKPEKARTREDARKEKNESPEKKGTRSASKVDPEKKEEAVKEKKDKLPKEKEKKEEKQVKDVKEDKPKPKKEDTPTKERKLVREKRAEEKPTKEKRENPVREKRDLSKEKKESPKEEKPLIKGKKEEIKSSSEEKSPKRKLERTVKEKKDPIKLKSEEIEEVEKTEEKPPTEIKTEEPILKKPKPKTEDSPSSEEEVTIKIESSPLLDDIKPSLINESGDEPPNKGKRKFLKCEDKDDKESLLGFSDSDESVTHEPSILKDIKSEIEVGDRVKVKYGRGRMHKIYDAKVLKIENDGLEKRYYVHYTGWNMRYDEWIKKSYIVPGMTGNKKFETTTKSLLPPGMKKLERTRLPGCKPVRKNSTSSTNSNVSRSTRSERKGGSESKKRMCKRSTGAADTSQESDSDRDMDDEEGNDADVEDSSALQGDSCFKEELFSDDEEKEKLEDMKRGDITELEKALEPIEDHMFFTSNEDKDSLSECKPIAKSENKGTVIDIESKVERESTPCSTFTDVKIALEKIEISQIKKQTDHSTLTAASISDQDAKAFSPEASGENALVPAPPSDNSIVSKNKISIPSALNFTGLIKKSEIESSDLRENISSNSGDSESAFLFSSINAHKMTDNKETTTSSESDYGVPVGTVKDSKLEDDHFSHRNIFSPTLKSEIHSENASTYPETSFSIEKKASTTGSPLPDLFPNKSSDVPESMGEAKLSCGLPMDSSSQNVYIPSFSPQNIDPSFNRSDNKIQSEPVDVSKMIPGILERLKNDVVTDFDSPPRKDELTFDFLRDGSNKCISRSDSSSSLRICESDTNDSNVESKDLGCKLPILPVMDNIHGNESTSKSTINSITEADPITPTQENNAGSNEIKEHEKNNENQHLNLNTPPRIDRSDKSEEHLDKIVCAGDTKPVTTAEDSPPETSTKEDSTNIDLKCEEMLTDSNHPEEIDNEDAKDTLFNDLIEIKDSSPSSAVSSIAKYDICKEIPIVKKEISEEPVSLVGIDKSPKDTSDSTSGHPPSSPSPKVESSEQNSAPDSKAVFEAISTLKSTQLSLKKEGKKKKFGKKLGKKFVSSEMFEKEDKDVKIKDVRSKMKKKMRFETFATERARNLEIKSKSKKLKKNKNKKRFKREDACGNYMKKVTDNKEGESKDFTFDKIKRKDKKKSDKKFLKCGMKNDDYGDSKMDLLKKKKGKKNRDKFMGDKKDFAEKKTKKKRKLLMDNIQDTDSDKESLPKLEKKRKKKKIKVKDCSSSDDGTDNFFKEESMDLPCTSSTRQEPKSDDPDMSFLLCEEKVPASPVAMNNMADDTSDSSSMEGGSSELRNAGNTSTVMDNTPPTTPSSTESLLSSSPSHERDPFPYPESTQSGRESVEGDVFRCSSNRTISRGSEEYHAATTLAFAVCQSVSEKPPPSELGKKPEERKKKRFRRCSESAKSPKHKSSFLRLPKVDNCYEDSSCTSLATMSPPYGSLNFSRSPPLRVSSTPEEISRYFYIPLHEKDPEKRIALLQKKMTELRKEYMSLRAEVIAIDHKRRKARKKVRDAAGSVVNPSIHSDDGQSCS